MILGLDISTSCVGIALLNSDDGSLIKLDHLILDDLDLYAAADVFFYYIRTLNPSVVFIEEPKKGFANQKTSNNTILLLNRFNGICSYLVYKQFNIRPIHINESTARKACGLKILPTKKSGKSQKEQAFEQMCATDLFKNYPWTLKRTGRVKDWHMDEMDAFIIGKAGYLMNKK